MDGELNKENLQSHNATFKTEAVVKTTVMAAPAKNTFKERLLAARSELDKKSDAGSGSSKTITKKTFSRLKAKLRIHTLFGGHSRSGGSDVVAKSVKTLENTYRTEPREGTEFSCSKAEEIMRKVFEGYLKDKNYDQKRFPLLSKSLADMIKERVKQTGLNRHKVVATVLITEDAGQTVRIGSRCLWNVDYDNYATYTFEGKGFSAIGCVYALYYE